MRDFILWAALLYFVIVLIGKHAERAKAANEARERRVVAGVRAWASLKDDLANNRLEVRTPMPTFLRSRKVWPLDPLRCQHGTPVFECVHVDCVRMRSRFLAMPDDA